MCKRRFKPNPADIVIIVIGPAGSGKSNFINKLTGNAEKPKASNLKPDTPAIDANQRDGRTLRVIAKWLLQKYPGGSVVKIAWTLYLHKITDNRASDSANKNLRTFGQLCGGLPQCRMRLVMTMCDIVSNQAVATRRETKLTSEFWQELMVEGATAHKFYNTRDSAEGIINGLLDMQNAQTLA